MRGLRSKLLGFRGAVTWQPPSSDRYGQAMVATLWGGAAIALALTAWKTIHVASGPNFSGQGNDFSVYWLAARDLLNGHTPYHDLSTSAAFLYPPFAALVVAPFGLLGYDAARTVFNLVGLAGILGTAALSLRLVRVSPLSPLAPAVFLGVALFEPTREAFWWGNVDCVMVLVEVLALTAAASGRWRVAGLILGVSLAAKPILLPLLLLPVLWRRWHALPVAALALVVPTAIAALLVPASSTYLTAVAPSMGQGLSTAQLGTDVAIAAVVRQLQGPVWLELGLRGLVVAVTALCLWRAFRSRPAGDPNLRLLVTSGLVMSAWLLVGSFAWSQYPLYLVPALLVPLVAGPPVVAGLAAVGAYAIGSPDVRLFWRFGPAVPPLRLCIGLVLVWLAMAAAGALRDGLAAEAAPEAPPIGPVRAVRPATETR